MKELQVRSFNFGKVYEPISKRWIENKNYGWYEKGKAYTTTIDIYRYLYGEEIDMNKYKELREQLIDKAVKSSVYTYYNEGATDPVDYEYMVSNDWYEVRNVTVWLQNLKIA